MSVQTVLHEWTLVGDDSRFSTARRGPYRSDDLVDREHVPAVDGALNAWGEVFTLGWLVEQDNAVSLRAVRERQALARIVVLLL